MLFLAEIDLEIVLYPGEYPSQRKKKHITRLVEADNEESAEGKIKREFENPDPYGESTHVRSVELSGVIR